MLLLKILSDKIKQCISYYKKEKFLGDAKFVKTNEHVLPTECWEMLNERRNSTFLELCNNHNKRLDEFAPHRHECKIKKLTKK